MTDFTVIFTFYFEMKIVEFDIYSAKNMVLITAQECDYQSFSVECTKKSRGIAIKVVSENRLDYGISAIHDQKLL